MAKKPRPRKLLDNVHAQEVEWSFITPMIATAEERGLSSFVYFIGERDGPFKIGLAGNPISRLRALQTGNPRHLKLERLILGVRQTEEAFHVWGANYNLRSGKTRSTNYNADYAPETEWFDPAGREDAYRLAEIIGEIQRTAPLGVGMARLHNVAFNVLLENGLELKMTEPVTLLANGAGYVTIPLRAAS